MNKITPTRVVNALRRRADRYFIKPFRDISDKRKAAKAAVKTNQYLDKYVEMVANMCGGFEGKTVLEVGADQYGKLLTRIAKDQKAGEALGVNLNIEDKELLPNCRVYRGDIRKTNFKDNYFDAMVSSAVFEHVHNLDVALDEMYRILKPGGVLYSHHGPMWSGSYGHHLWTRYGGKPYTYWDFILPPHCHLLMKPEEVLEICLAKTNNPEASQKIVKYVYESTDQNQLMYEDYERIIKASKFEILVMKGYDVPELSGKYITKDFIKNLEILKKKYPGYTNFQFDGMTVLLRKPL